MTEPCIGWHTDDPCPVWGHFHGCRCDARRYHSTHTCHCGATLTDRKIRRTHRHHIYKENAA